MSEIEVWKPILNHEEYEVSNMGRVRNRKRGTVLSPSKNKENKWGYWRVILWKNNKPRCVPVHTLVAAAFLGERPDGYVVDHIDADKLNNKACNLEYVTQTENIRRAIQKGLNPRVKSLSNETIARVKGLLIQKNPKLTYKQIANQVGLSPSVVGNIYHASRHDCDTPVSLERRSKLTESDINAILDLLDKNQYLQKEIAIMFGVPDSTISRIKQGTYKHRTIQRLVS